MSGANYCRSCGNQLSPGTSGNCPKCGAHIVLETMGSETLDSSAFEGQVLGGQHPGSAGSSTLVDLTPVPKGPEAVPSSQSSGSASGSDETNKTVADGVSLPVQPPLEVDRTIADIQKTVVGSVDFSLLEGVAESGQGAGGATVADNLGGISPASDRTIAGEAPVDRTLVGDPDKTIVGTAGSGNFVLDSDAAELAGQWDRTLAEGGATILTSLKQPEAEEDQGKIATHLSVQHRKLSAKSDTSFQFSGDYELLQKLGEGGMGVVYAARQASIDRVVAVKMLKAGGDQGDSQKAKFLAEAAVTGELEHPNIVPIYDLGKNSDGALFYSMKRVHGTPWNRCVKTMSLEENLDVLLRVADAVAFAHDRGVVHRDLKPENVMLGGFGEVLVMDWGLAMPVGRRGAGGVQLKPSMGGTPAYMAPEMATGPFDIISFPADIYLLGAILYEIVTGKPPHHGPTVMKCLVAAARNEIQPTESRSELVDIARRAMATDPEDRYRTVQEFQRAIRDYREHAESIVLSERAQQDLEAAEKSGDYTTFARAVFAFEESLELWDGNARASEGLIQSRAAYARTAKNKGDLDLAGSLLDRAIPDHESLYVEVQSALEERETRVRRLAVLKRTAIGLAAGMFLVVSAALIWVLDANGKERLARKSAEEAREAALLAQQEESKARLEAEDAQRETAESLVREEEQRRLAEENERIAEAAAEEAREQRMAAETARADAETARDTAVQAAEAERVARAAADQARQETEAALEREAEQRAIAQTSERNAVIARDEAERQRELAQYEAYVARINAAASKIEEQDFDRARALLMECVPEEGVEGISDYRDWEWRRLWYLCHRSRRDWDVEVPVEAIRFSPQGDAFALGGFDDRVRLYSIGGDELRSWQVGGTKIVALDWIRRDDGQWIATADDRLEGSVNIWDATTGELLKTLSDPQGHEAPVTSLEFSRDGRWLATASYDRTAKLWDLETGRVQKTFTGHRRWVWSVRFSPDGRHLATASEDGTVRVWETESGESYPAFLGHDGPVYTADFSADGRWIASGGIDGLVLQWAWDRDSLVSFDHRKAVRDFSQGKPVEARTLRGLRILDGHTAAVRDLRFGQREGKEVLVSTGHDHTIRTWNVETGSELSVLQGHGRWVRSCDIDPQGDWIVSGGYDGLVRLWEAAQQGETQVLQARRLRGHDDAVLAAVFDSKGERIITASRDRTVREWNQADGTERNVYREGHSFLARAVVALPDGQRFVTSAVDGTTRIWNLSSGTEARVLRPTGRSAVLAVAPQGDRIATGDDAAGITIWSSDSGEVLGRWKSELEAMPTVIEFDTVGNSLLVGDERGRVSLLVPDSSGSGDYVRQTTWSQHTDRVSDLIWLDESRFVTLGRDSIAVLRDRDQEAPLHIWSHGEPVIWGSRLPNGDLLTLGLSGTLRGWNASGDKPVFVSVPEVEGVVAASAALTKDSTRGVVIDERSGRLLRFAIEGALIRWDPALAANSPAGVDPNFVSSSVPLGEPAAVAFTSDATGLLVVGGEATTLYDEEEIGASGVGAMRRRFRPQGSVGAIAVSDSWMATGSWDGSVWIWDRKTGLVGQKWEGSHRGRVTAMAFDASGDRLISADDRGEILIRSLNSGDSAETSDEVRMNLDSSVLSLSCLTQPVGKIELLVGTESGELLGADFAGNIHYRATPAIGAVRRIAIRQDADGTRLALAGGSGKALIWSLEDQSPMLELPGHSAAVNDLGWSQDGRRVITGSDDFTVKLWDSATGKELLTLRGHDREVTSVGFDPNGRDVLSASLDGSAILWRSDTLQP